MPKGVDHEAVLATLTDSERVQKSLMPKGVDHLHLKANVRLWVRAKIFDAERR